MDGLTRLYIFKQKQHCEPFDLSRFVVDIRESHLEYWTPSYSETHPREHNSKRSTTYHHWCALPTKRALVTHSPYILPKNVLLMSFAVQLASDFCDHTLRFKTVTWYRSNSPTCDLSHVMVMISKMSSMFFSTAPIIPT
jgi:hypothetical protein